MIFVLQHHGVVNCSCCIRGMQMLQQLQLCLAPAALRACRCCSSCSCALHLLPTVCCTTLGAMHIAESVYVSVCLSVYLSVWLAVDLLLMSKDHVNSRADAKMSMIRHSCFAQAAQQFCNIFNAGVMMIQHHMRGLTCRSWCVTPGQNQSGTQSQRSNSAESKHHPHSWLTLPQFQALFLACSLSLALFTPQIKARSCSKLAGKLAAGL